MNRLLVIVFILINMPLWGQENCAKKGIELKGNVQIVAYNADLNVFIRKTDGLNIFPVTLVNSVWECGDWHIVDFNGDFTIKLVKYETEADIVIRLKESSLKEDFLKKYVTWELIL